MAKNKKDNGDQPDSNSGNGDESADNFGLPDIEYKPLDRDQEPIRETVIESHETFTETVSEKPASTGIDSEDYDEEPSSKAPLFIGLIILVVVIAAGILTYKFWYLPKAEKEKIELAKKKADEERQATEARLAREREEAERKRQDSIQAANVKPAVGTIEMLSARTRRYYVIVTSDIDDDLVMDFAKKISKKGVSSKIIPPYGTYKYFRLGVADFETFNEAQSSADGFKGDYGAGVWVMRY